MTSNCQLLTLGCQDDEHIDSRVSTLLTAKGSTFIFLHLPSGMATCVLGRVQCWLETTTGLAILTSVWIRSSSSA